MNNQTLFRYSGLAAIASAILYVLSLGVSFAGSTGGLGTVLYIISSLLFLVVITALYGQLRTEAGPVALAALVLLGALTIWSFFIDPTQSSPVFGPLALAYGVGFILYGWLQRRSSHYPNGLGNLAIVTGVISVAAGIVLLAGASFDIFGLFNLILSVPYVIWLIWQGRFFLKGNTVDLRVA